MSDAVLKESVFPKNLAKTEEEEANTAESFHRQDPCVKILPLDQVQGTEVEEIINVYILFSFLISQSLDQYLFIYSVDSISDVLHSPPPFSPHHGLVFYLKL